MQLRTAIDSRTWPAVEGRITYVVRTQKRFRLRYEYEVADRTFESYRIAYFSLAQRSELTRAFRSGSRVTVHHSPTDPDTAVLRTGATPAGVILAFALPLILALLAGLVLANAWSRHRDRGQVATPRVPLRI